METHSPAPPVVEQPFVELADTIREYRKRAVPALGSVGLRFAEVTCGTLPEQAQAIMVSCHDAQNRTNVTVEVRGPDNAIAFFASVEETTPGEWVVIDHRPKGKDAQANPLEATKPRTKLEQQQVDALVQDLRDGINYVPSYRRRI